MARYAVVYNETVYGLGTTRDAAMADARNWGTKVDRMTVVEVNDEQAAAIENGVVSTVQLGLES